MNLTLTFEPTVEEIGAAIRANSRRARRVIWPGAFITVAAGVALIALDSPILGVIALLIGGFYLLMLGSLKTVAAKEAARLCNETTLVIGPERYSFMLPSGSADTLWELTKVVVSPRCWTFTVANKISLIVPRRVMSEQQQAEFAVFLKQRDPRLVKVV